MTMVMQSHEIIEGVELLINGIGEDPTREGLKNTPNRVFLAYRKLFEGYNIDPKEILTTFNNDEHYDEIILLKGIDFTGMCEHHMLPFIGKGYVAYAPHKDGVIVGISKLARLLEVFSRRLTIQERICSQVANTLFDLVPCQGAACVLASQHCCIACRGVEKQNARMVTSTLKGIFFDKPQARQELFHLIGHEL